jgi:rhomboid protease GluP
MPLENTRAASEAEFPADFNAYVDGNYNRDLGGKGRLIVRTDEPRFVFVGRPRGRIFLGKHDVEFALRSDQIANVLTHERGVELTTTAGNSGKRKTPFVFTCESEQVASAIAALLPATRDAEFIAGETFLEQIRQLPSAGTGLRSLTNLVIFTNIVVFVVMGFLGAGWIQVTSLLPYIRYGANNAAATTDGEWWRLVTCMFLHYGLVHLLLNAWALFQVGHLVERLYGRALFALIYLGSGVIGSLATLRWNGDRIWSAGASGAVFGIYGALLGYLEREKHGVPASVFQPMLKSTLLFAGYNLFYGAVNPHIDNAAHIGGFASGALLGWLCALPLDLERRAAVWLRRGAAALAVATIVIAIGVRVAPRYHYRVSEELAWAAANDQPQKRERGIVEREIAAVAAFEKDHDGVKLATWLEREGLPFYRAWLRQLDGLALAPERATAKRRAELRRVLQAKIAAYEQLRADVQRDAPGAIARFRGMR